MPWNSSVLLAFTQAIITYIGVGRFRILRAGGQGLEYRGWESGMGSVTLKCNSLNYNYFGKMCYYITIQLLYFVNVINYITITLPK